MYHNGRMLGSWSRCTFISQVCWRTLYSYDFNQYHIYLRSINSKYCYHVHWPRDSVKRKQHLLRHQHGVSTFDLLLILTSVGLISKWLAVYHFHNLKDDLNHPFTNHPFLHLPPLLSFSVRHWFLMISVKWSVLCYYYY